MTVLTPVNRIYCALKTMFNDGPKEFFYLASMEYNRHLMKFSPPWRYILLPSQIILYQIHLLLDERAIAYPRGRFQWQIIHLPSLKKGRQLPTLNPSGGYRHGSKHHKAMMRQIYSYPEFVEVEENDVVVDVGAYIGGFSMVAAESAAVVLAVEPTAATDNILKSNVAEYPNIEVVPKAAWHERDTLEINQSYHPSENSQLEVDSYEKGQTFSVEADTVPNIARNLGYKKIDFLKIEAEGVEPEILEGALDDGMHIQKIAIDTSAERDGKTSGEEVRHLLEENGYVWKQKEQEDYWGEDIVFAIRNQ